MAVRKVVVFMRAYNDVDHLTPVVWKLSKSTDVHVSVVMRTGPELVQDYRIDFLRTLPRVEVHHINEYFASDAPVEGDESASKPAARTVVERMRRRVQRMLGMQPPKQSMNANLAPEPIRAMLHQLFDGVDKGLIVFDWVSSASANRRFAELTCDAAREMGIRNVALPHGDSPYYNKMFKLADINYTSVEHFGNNPTDVVVVPNSLTAERYVPFRDDSQLKVLGSARYNKEWMDVLAGIMPVYENLAAAGKLKLVMFLRNTVFPIFWDEVRKAVEICTQFPDVYLVVKHHTRGGRPDHKNMTGNEDVGRLNQMSAPNLQIVYNDVHSGSLLAWCDAVLELGTSISFEAIRLNKPLLALEYLHANLSTVAHYIPSVALNYKDQLYDAIVALREDRTLRFYNEDDRQRFFAQIIDYPDENVLQRYVDLLLERLECSA